MFEIKFILWKEADTFTSNDIWTTTICLQLWILLFKLKVFRNATILTDLSNTVRRALTTLESHLFTANARNLYLELPNIFKVKFVFPSSSYAWVTYAERSKLRLWTRSSGLGTRVWLGLSRAARAPYAPVEWWIHSSLIPRTRPACPFLPSAQITNLRPEMRSTCSLHSRLN